MKKRVIGIVNFSTLCKKNSGSFISSREKDWSEHQEQILSDERLALRTKLFTEISLPLFDLQSRTPRNGNFQLVVLISSLLPSKYKTILMAAASIRPWLQIEERGIDDWLDAPGAIKRALKRMNMEDFQDNCIFSSFRIDDDDFVSTQYLENLEKYITTEHKGKFITFSLGYKCVWNRGKITNLAPIHKPLIAIGLAHIGCYNASSDQFTTEPQTVFAGMNHFDLKKSHGVIEDSGKYMFMWSQHPHQDTIGRFKSVELEDCWSEIPADIIGSVLEFPSIIGNIDVIDAKTLQE